MFWKVVPGCKSPLTGVLITAWMALSPARLEADPSPLPGYEITERRPLAGESLVYEKHVRKGLLLGETPQEAETANPELMTRTKASRSDPSPSKDNPEADGLSPSVLHVVRAKLGGESPLRLSVIGRHAERKTPSEHAQASGAQVVLNGSFFDPQNRALGLVVQNGSVWPTSPDTPGYHVFGCAKNGGCDIEVTTGVIKDKLGSLPLEMALSGRPLLLKNGQTRQATEDESCPRFCATRHPRSAIGLDKQRQTLILALAEGRRPNASGLSLAELAEHMKALGAYRAVNLDGGGSSTLVIDGNRRSGRPFGEAAERPVVTVLGLFF